MDIEIKEDLSNPKLNTNRKVVDRLESFIYELE